MPRLRHFYGLNHLRYVTTSIPKGGIAPASSTRSGLSGFSFKFVTTLADLRGELGFRIVGYVLIPPGGTVTYCSGPRTAPTPPTAPACSAGPAVRPCGSSSDVGSCRVANKGIRIIMGHALQNWGQVTGNRGSNRKSKIVNPKSERLQSLAPC